MIVLLVLFTIVVDQDTAHTKVGDDGWVFFRELPENEVARVAQAQIACPVQTLSNIATLADLATGLVFFLLRCPHLAEAELNVQWELKCRTVERASLLFGQAGLVLYSLMSRLNA